MSTLRQTRAALFVENTVLYVEGALRYLDHAGQEADIARCADHLHATLARAAFDLNIVLDALQPYTRPVVCGFCPAGSCQSTLAAAAAS